ncbi:MAG: YggS family pyridoxal phosphate-dependent enzyme [Gammaproteobacteria bacterium]
MSGIAENLDEIRDRIASATAASGRDRAAVQLVAVSKNHSVAAIQEAINAGHTRFGENIAQEAAMKIAALAMENVEWHFIGRVQSNKTGQLAKNFHWVQSVDRIKIAERLNASRPAGIPALNVCIQVNLDQEASKVGLLDVGAVLEMAGKISAMENLRLRGIMAIPPFSQDVGIQQERFRKVKKVYKALRASYPDIDTLSMGMTADFEAAIQEGSTMIRIGTAIFGTRG